MDPARKEDSFLCYESIKLAVGCSVEVGNSEDISESDYTVTLGDDPTTVCTHPDEYFNRNNGSKHRPNTSRVALELYLIAGIADEIERAPNFTTQRERFILYHLKICKAVALQI